MSSYCCGDLGFVPRRVDWPLARGFNAQLSSWRMLGFQSVNSFTFLLCLDGKSFDRNQTRSLRANHPADGAICGVAGRGLACRLPCRKLLINTRLQPGAKGASRGKNRLNGFSLVRSWFTALKRGVNFTSDLLISLRLNQCNRPRFIRG